jgi:hypothetical protein
VSGWAFIPDIFQNPKRLVAKPVKKPLGVRTRCIQPPTMAPSRSGQGFGLGYKIGPEPAAPHLLRNPQYLTQ